MSSLIDSFMFPEEEAQDYLMDSFMIDSPAIDSFINDSPAIDSLIDSKTPDIFQKDQFPYSSNSSFISSPISEPTYFLVDCFEIFQLVFPIIAFNLASAGPAFFSSLGSITSCLTVIYGFIPFLNNAAKMVFLSISNEDPLALLPKFQVTFVSIFLNAGLMFSADASIKDTLLSILLRGFYSSFLNITDQGYYLLVGSLKLQPPFPNPLDLVFIVEIQRSLKGFFKVLFYRKLGDIISTSKSSRSMSLYLFFSCCLFRLPDTLLVQRGGWEVVISNRQVNIIRQMELKDKQNRSYLIIKHLKYLRLFFSQMAPSSFFLLSFFIYAQITSPLFQEQAVQVGRCLNLCISIVQAQVIQCIFMITHKPSIQASPKIVILEIDSEDRSQTVRNRFKSHKVRRPQGVEATRNSKAVKLLDKIDFQDFLTEQSQKQCGQKILLDLRSQNPNKSSYLAYKEDQRLNRIRPNKKSVLKSKWSQNYLSMDSNARTSQQKLTQTQKISRNRRKMSLVMLGETFSEGIEEGGLARSRNIYIKTSEGKRQRIDPNSYMTKIKEKIQSLYECESGLGINPHCQAHPFQEAPLIKISPISQDKQTLIRRFRPKNFKREFEILSNENEECRPWTSRKSEVPEQ